MIRVSKVKLGKAKKQEAKLFSILFLCRQLYNAALQQRIEAYKKQGISLSLYDQYKELTELRSESEDYRSIPAAMTRLTSLHRLDKAFKGFFGRLKKGEKPGFPRFKGRDRFNTIVFGKESWKIEGKKLIVKAGQEGSIILRMRNAIHRKGKIIGLRLVKRTDRWWADFLVDIGEAPFKKQSKNGIGIDVGIRTFVTLSDGVQVEHPRFSRKSQEQFKAAQQEVSRKRKGSNNRRKAKYRLSRVHEKIKDRRKNFIFQTVSKLVDSYDGFAVEKLDVRGMFDRDKTQEGMSKKGTRGLRRGIMDSAWSMFMSQLESKAEEAAIPVVRVDPRGTSQRCSECGSVVRKTLRDRVHECRACGLILDRDLNAARNILERGKDDLGCRSVPRSGDDPVEGTEILS